jgi:4-amino-4-deoxy-L-arabinose transferase-like glycosyltransferase
MSLTIDVAKPIGTKNPLLKDPKPYFTYAIAIHLVLATLKLLFIQFGPFDLFTEEAQYWLWSQNLDWSYYSKPPMIAIFNYLSTSILGNTELAIRGNAVLIGFLIAITMFKFTEYMFKDSKLAFYTTIFLIAFPTYTMGSVMFMTDGPLALFWMLTTFYFYKAAQENKPIDWILTGLFIGLGFLSKYNMYMFFGVALVYIYFYKKSLFTEKWAYIAVFISFLAIIPVLIWNYQNDFVTFKHVGTLSGMKVETYSISNTISYLGEYIGGQLAINGPFFILFFIGGFRLAVKKGWDEKLVYLILPVVMAFTFFLIIAFKKRVEINWPVFGYATLPVLGAYYIHYKGIWKKAVAPYVVTLILLAMLICPPAFDFIGLNIILPPKADPSKRYVGYSTVAGEINEILTTLENKEFFIFSDSYHSASEMAFYVKGNPQTYCINLGRRMNQFDIWRGIEKYEHKQNYGIFVNNGEVPSKVKEGFEEYVFHKEVPVIYRGEVTDVMHIHVLKNLKHIEELEINVY